MSDVTLTLTATEAETLKAVLRNTYQSKTVVSMRKALKAASPAVGKHVRCYHCATSWPVETASDAEVTKHLAEVHHYSVDDYQSDNAQNTAWSLVHQATDCTIVGGLHSH